MFIKKSDGPRTVRLADGSYMTLADLPPKNTKRWVASRKIAVVKAVKAELITKEDALQTYALSEEEFSTWEFLADKYGESGLKTTKLKNFR